MNGLRPWKAKGWCLPLRGRLGQVAVTLMLLLQMGCQYPKDAEHTLERVQGGVLHVGLTANSPWVEAVQQNPAGSTAEPAGLEPDLIRALAQELGAEVRWYWGAESELIHALEQFELDLVAGGLTNDSMFRSRVALTRPFYRSRATVGFPGTDADLPADLEGLQVGVSPRFHLDKVLQDQGALPQRLDQLPNDDIPIAAPEMWLRAHGYVPGPWELKVRHHVMALPPGENAWALRVQRYLDSLTIPPVPPEPAAGGAE